MLNQLDERTKNYLQAIRNNLHFLGENGGECLSLKEILTKKGLIEKTAIKELWKDEGFNFTTILYQYTIDGVTKFCAEVWVQYDIDGVYTHTFIFSQRPNQEQVETIRLVSELETKFAINQLKPTFTCWECDQKSHWLDSGKNFEESYENLKESYCGC